MELLLKGQRAPLLPYEPRTPQTIEYMSVEETLANVGGTMMFDCEVYINFFLVAFKNIETGKYIVLEHSPDVFLNHVRLSWILHNYTVVGFNSYVFDIPIVWLIYTLALRQYPNIAERVQEAAYQIIAYDTKRKELQERFDFKIYPTRHIDLINVCPLTGSLKLYGARLHAPRIQDMPFDISEPLTREQANIVTSYCVNDLDTTQLVFFNLMEQLKLRDDLSVQYKRDLMSKSDPQLAEAVIECELIRLTGKKPYPPKEIGSATHKYKIPEFVKFNLPQLQQALNVIRDANYEVLDNSRLVVPPQVLDYKIPIGKGIYRIGNGGLHSSEKKITHKATADILILDRDVTSYYPAIILNLGLCPKHLGTDFLTAYRSVFERRLAAKKTKNYAVSEGLKIAVNGCFGKLGNQFSILYSPELLIQVTITGQLSLLMLIEAFEMKGFEVISANTDGIVVKCPIDRREQINELVRMWEQTTGFETEETEYSMLLSRDVNNYIAIKKPDQTGRIEAKCKGAYLNPWGTSGDEFKKLAIYRFHKNPMTTIAIEAAIAYITRNVPLEQTIAQCTDIRKFTAIKNVTGGAHKNGRYLGKVVRWYYAVGVYGSINYIRTNNKVPETEGANPLMDLPNEFPRDIKYAWYIERAIRILEEIGYQSRQQTLF